MSTTQKLNLTIGAVSLVLVACGGFLVNNDRQGGSTAVQLKVADRQQQLVGDLVSQTATLVAGVGREEALAARTALGGTITSFDEGLGALLAGGAVRLDDGHARHVRPVSDEGAREALEAAAQVWTDTGVPLGDLAAGQFSPYSAAGQEAVAGLQAHQQELAQHMADAAASLRRGAAARAALAGVGQWAAVGLGAALLALLGTRRFLAWRASRPARPPRPKTAKAGGHPVDGDAAPLRARIPGDHDDARPARPPRRGERAPVYVPSIDFDHVNAAVDQLSVDMNTIAGSTEKMRQAIDSVGFALQGMLYSLNEMAQDTGEGAQIVRSANNAAVFTADAAGELVEAAREMSRIVGRVTQLAERTRHVAGDIEGEALQTGRTGEAFTSVVAQEVKGLARQTNKATCEIDQTVNEVLATARQYEEAIGQIIKNIATINKVSQNLGQLMIDPPRRVQAGTITTTVAAAATTTTDADAPQAAARGPAVQDLTAEDATVQDTTVQDATVQDDPLIVEPTAQQTAQATAEAIAAAAPAIAPAPVAATPATPPAPAATTIPGLGKADGGSNGNVFLLGKPRRKPEAAGAPAAAATPPAASPTPAPAPTATENGSQADGGSNQNVFLLNKSKAAKPEVAAAPAPAAPPPPAPAAPAPTAPVAAAAPVDPTPEPAGSNIFMLNRPKKKVAPAEDGGQATVAIAEPVAEPVTVPAAAPAAPAAPAATGDAPRKNFVMLNKKPR